MERTSAGLPFVTGVAVARSPAKNDIRGTQGQFTIPPMKRTNNQHLTIAEILHNLPRQGVH